MAFARQSDAQAAQRFARALALAACALAITLGAWRASAVLTAPPTQIADLSAAEASLARIVDPIAGSGMARVSIARNAEGGRTVLVLLDASARDTALQLERIIPVAAGLTTAGADRVIIEEAVFARGLPGRPDTMAWTELGALGLIASLCGWLALRPGTQVQTSKPLPDAAPVYARPAEPVRPVRIVNAMPGTSDAGELVRRDPARAAAVVRSWIGPKDEAG